MREPTRQFRNGETRAFGLRPAWAAAIGAFVLSGCVDTATDLGAPRAGAYARSQRPVARPGVSPRGASVVLASVEGAPEDVAARFTRIFARTAESRDIVTTKDASAPYRVRGYLTANASEGATRLSYVWDIFERNGRRAQRLTDEIAVKGGGDPWAGLDENALTAIAARGADDLAAFLSNTPEAIAAAGAGEAGVSVATASRAEDRASSPAGSARPLGFAEAR